MARKLLIAIAALLALVLGVGAFLPKDVTVTRSLTIAAPAERLYALVAAPRQWPQWSPWNARDPKMTITYGGAASGAGATWSWASKSEGDGQMRLTEAKAPTAVAYELTIAGMGPPSHGRFDLAPSGSATTVTWTMTATMGMGPIGGWMALWFPSVIGKDFDAGLANLKKLAELASAPEPTPPAGADAAVPGAASPMGAAPEPTGGALPAAPEPAPRPRP